MKDRPKVSPELVREWMATAGLTILEAAEICEVDDSTVVRWRRVGVARSASVDRLRRAAEKIKKELAA